MIRKEIAFEDDRGTITDIFTSEPHEPCTIIFTKKGGIRGNHYHKVTRQYDFLVSGKFAVYSKKQNEVGVRKTLWRSNELIAWEFGEAHEFVALEDSVFITFADGARGGGGFEDDTFRLDTPLHEEYKDADHT